jgi:uncharacterized membrane-anchored protein
VRDPSDLAVGKLPQVTLLFWIMKISATTLGETSGDLLSMTLNLGYVLSSVLLFGFFIATVVPQLASRRYQPVLYWSVILSTTMVGTTISDFMDRTLHLGYVLGSAVLLALLVATFAGWRLSGLPFAMDKIRSTKAEALYWVAILFSNTLGTALGDFFADTSGLGYAGGAELIGGALLLAALAARYTRISKVFLFWLAFVLTRPFGATFGDLFTKPAHAGGLGVGTVDSSLVLLAILALSVAYVSWTQTRAMHRIGKD